MELEKRLVGINGEVLVKSPKSQWKVWLPLEIVQNEMENARVKFIDQNTVQSNDKMANAINIYKQAVRDNYNNRCAECNAEAKKVKCIGEKRSIKNSVLLCNQCINKPVKIKPDKKVNIDNDENKIYKFNNVYNIKGHAVKRVRERSSLKEATIEEAFQHCLNIINNGEYLGWNSDNNGILSESYILGNEEVFVRQNTIITFIKGEQKSSYEPIAMKIYKVYRTELNKLKKLCLSKEKYLENLKYEADVEIAELTLLLHRARSQSKKLAYQARINAIKISLTEYEDELMKIYRDKSKVTKLVLKASC